MNENSEQAWESLWLEMVSGSKNKMGEENVSRVRRDSHNEEASSSIEIWKH